MLKIFILSHSNDTVGIIEKYPKSVGFRGLLHKNDRLGKVVV